MPKRYLTKKEKEARLKKGLGVGAIVFVVLTVLTALSGIGLAKLGDMELRLQMQFDYWKDPWDGEGKFDFISKKGDVWAYYEALMCVEDDAIRAGGEGISYDRSVGTVLCVDTSSIENEKVRSAAEKMYEDYAKRKGLRFRTGSLEQLKEEGLIASSGESYKEGCLLQIFDNGWDREKIFFTVDMFFYYGNTNGQGATVMLTRKENLKAMKEAVQEEQIEKISDDGEWAAVILSTMVS